ncbi:MAG: hypothetical protein R3D66_05570 [Alphaproteobacteria bacterium]
MNKNGVQIRLGRLRSGGAYGLRIVKPLFQPCRIDDPKSSVEQMGARFPPVLMTPGVSSTIASFFPASLLNRLDLPY